MRRSDLRESDLCEVYFITPLVNPKIGISRIELGYSKRAAIFLRFRVAALSIMATFDDVLVLTGELGRSQLFVYVLMGLACVVAAMQSFSIIFVGGRQDHWCFIPALANYSIADQKYIAMFHREQKLDVYRRPEKHEFSHCHRYDLDFSNYSTEDFANWNRSAMYDDNTPTVACEEWIFDKGTYQTTLSTQVRDDVI